MNGILLSWFFLSPTPEEGPTPYFMSKCLLGVFCALFLVLVLQFLCRSCAPVKLVSLCTIEEVEMNEQGWGIVAQVMVLAIVIAIILLLLGVGLLVLIHVYVARSLIRGVVVNGTMVERRSSGNTSISQADLDKLPNFNYKEREKGTSPVDCVVCLENLKAGQKCRLLPLCKHSFHVECVDLWLLRTPVCPICRTKAELSKMSG